MCHNVIGYCSAGAVLAHCDVSAENVFSLAVTLHVSAVTLRVSVGCEPVM